MAEKDKKYYWLKLKRDFFKRHDIQIIEDMPNGKDYILFYVKLLCESVDHDGRLRFNEEIPYNEQMLATITHTNVDIVRSAVKVFSQLQMMEILDDGTIYMREVQKMLGCESYWAERSRVYRAKQKCLTSSNECQTRQGKSIDIDKEKDIDIEKEREKEEINKKEPSINATSVFDGMMVELSKTITPISYETFFRCMLKCEGYNDDALLLKANGLIMNSIDSNYKEKVEAAIVKASKGRLTGYKWRV